MIVKSTSQNTPYQINSDALAGALSGFLICVLLQPLEIVKVCLIVNPMQLATIEKAKFTTSFALSVKLIYKQEGLRGFWRGLSPALLRVASGSAVYFQVLTDLSKKFKNMGVIGSKSDFLSSGIARTISSIICNPLTVIRTRFEMIGFTEYKNTWDALRKIHKTEGIQGFFKGSLTCMLRDGPFAALYYTLLNITKKHIKPLSMPNHVNTMISGILAGFISTTLTHPFDVLRTKLQADMSFKTKGTEINKSGIYQGLKTIWVNEGIAGLMKGIIPRLLRKPLANTLSFTIFEIFKGHGNSSNDHKAKKS